MIPIPVLPRNTTSRPSTQTNSSHPSYDLHISKNTRKRSKHYTMTINTAFDTVVQHCQQQHGGVTSTSTSSCWLYPNLLQIFRTIHMATIQNRHGFVTKAPQSQAQHQPISVRLYSIEVWNAETNEFAAGEIGYTVGDTIYTSLTGCCVEDSAGSVQMAALGALLIYLQSFTIWDLGMGMPYKQTLGAQLIPRQEFINLVHALRGMPERTTANHTTTATTTKNSTPLSSPMSATLSSIQWPIQQWDEPVNCRDIIDAISMRDETNHVVPNTATIPIEMDTSGTTPQSSTVLPLNKKQRKELKKHQMRMNANGKT